MAIHFPKLMMVALAAAALLMSVTPTLQAKSEDLGNGFLHHGVATPVSQARGIVATTDGDGNNVVLVWLYDHRGGYALLSIDATTGKATQHPSPFPPGGDGPFSSILSSNNRYYTHFNSHFAEFDPTKPGFTFHHATKRQMAMGMTEDDNGVIWSMTYPNSGVVSYNPKTGQFKDYGYVHDENWAQYQRYVAADDAGWIYFGVGNTNSQIVAFNPETGKGKPMLPEDHRTKGSGNVYRGTDGKVYGHNGNKEHWYAFHQGQMTPLEQEPDVPAKPIITSHQGLFHRDLPDGSQVQKVDLINRELVVKDKEGKTQRLDFDYTSEGAHIMGMAAAPDGTMVGGTAFPMRFFSYDPKTDEITNRAAYGQWNTVVRQGDKFFVGAYSGGYLLEWDPSKPWVDTKPGNKDSNPLYHLKSSPPINRPHDLLAHPDGNTIVMAGTPGYGYTGGGLLFWDRKNQSQTLVTHDQLLPDLSTLSLAALPDGTIVGGTTTNPGSGGEKKADLSELYLLDPESKKIIWHEPLFPDVQNYSELIVAPSGLVYGFTGRDRFFVFDPETKKVVHEQNTQEAFGPINWQQGPRSFVQGPDETIYVLFTKGIAKVEPGTYKFTLLAESPVPIGPGGDYLDGRIYFGSGSHIYSWDVPGE